MVYKATAYIFGAIDRTDKTESTLKEKPIYRLKDLNVIEFDLCDNKGLSVKLAITEETKLIICEMFENYNNIGEEDTTITINEEIYFGGSTGKRKDRDSINYYNPEKTKGITIKREEDRISEHIQ